MYIKTGNYDLAAAINFSGTTELNLICLGLCQSNTGTRQITFYRKTNISGLILITDTTETTFQVTQNFATAFYNKCKIIKTGSGTSWAYIGTGMELILHNCVVNTTVTRGLFSTQEDFNRLELVGCFGNVGAGYAFNSIVNYTVKYNKFSVYFLVSLKTSAIEFVNNTITGNVLFTTATTSVIKYNKITAGKLTTIACDNSIIKWNNIHASFLNKVAENVAFQLNSNTPK